MVAKLNSGKTRYYNFSEQLERAVACALIKTNEAIHSLVRELIDDKNVFGDPEKVKRLHQDYVPCLSILILRFYPVLASNDVGVTEKIISTVYGQ